MATKSAHEMWHEQRSFLRNRYRQEYLDYMVRVVEQAKLDGDSFTLAAALTACADWMYSAGRLEEALSYYQQRLDPAVWHEDKLEMRCVRAFVGQIENEIATRERSPNG
jgi:hypothetical protein